MHPAFSIIFFTTASGAGFGLIAVASFFVLLGYGDAGRGTVWAVTVSAFVLSVAGLLSSAGHLGRPERAWRAFSQWRTSWLSREGVIAPLTLGLAALLFLTCLVGQPGGVLARILALLTILACLGTITCTAMIYASLKPIPRWNNGWVLPGYLALAGASGTLLLLAIGHATGHRWPAVELLALLSIACAFLLKEGYWRYGFDAYGASSVESATGLGRIGRVTSFEAPHTEENFLLHEMGYRIGRKHSARIRMIVRICAFALPFFLTLLVLILSGSALAIVFALLSVVSAGFGIILERWLFFAEAKHVVTLYYPRVDAAA